MFLALLLAFGSLEIAVLAGSPSKKTGGLRTLGPGLLPSPTEMRHLDHAHRLLWPGVLLKTAGELVRRLIPLPKRRGGYVEMGHRSLVRDEHVKGGKRRG